MSSTRIRPGPHKASTSSSRPHTLQARGGGGEELREGKEVLGYRGGGGGPMGAEKEADKECRQQVCNWFPALNGGLPVRTWPGPIRWAMAETMAGVS